MNLVLIGYMGSGKTAVGKALAKTLSYPFFDLDQVIEEQEGTAISELFTTKGEIYFRKKEAEILKEIVGVHQKMVLATGGGTPCYGNTMDFLLGQQNVKTIYLKSSLEILTQRLYPERSVRPLISHLQTEEDLKDFVRKHLFERTFIYERSSEVIAADQLSVEEVVKEIVARLF
jgi:shikimate kinase